MTRIEQHQDLSAMILVARSLPTGLPWSLAEDEAWVARERVLWAQMTEEEREVAQRQLRAFWDRRNALRALPVKDSWGAWTVSAPNPCPIPDSAFGLGDLRPEVRGITGLAAEHPSRAELLSWLWGKGFSPVKVCQDTSIQILVPAQRLIPETERLLGVLLRDRVQSRIEIEGRYDPVTGKAYISLLVCS